MPLSLPSSVCVRALSLCLYAWSCLAWPAQISDRKLVRRIKHMMKTNRPWAGAFLRTNDADESDVIRESSDIRPVGTFVQITHIQVGPARGWADSCDYVACRLRTISLSLSFSLFFSVFLVLSCAHTLVRVIAMFHHI